MSYWAFAPRTFQVKALIGVEQSNAAETTPANLRLRETVQRLTSKEVQAGAQRALSPVKQGAGSAPEPGASVTVSIKDRSHLELEVTAPSERVAEAWPEVLVREYQASRTPVAPAAHGNASSQDLSGALAAPAPATAQASIPSAPDPAAGNAVESESPEMDRWRRLRRTVDSAELNTLEKLAVLAAAETEFRTQTGVETAPPAWNRPGPNSWEALYEERRKLEAALSQASPSRTPKGVSPQDLRNSISSLDAKAAAQLQAALEWLDSQRQKIEAAQNATRALKGPSHQKSRPRTVLPPSLFYLGLLESRELTQSPTRLEVLALSTIGGLVLALVLPMLMQSIR
ncbi:MAG: hypothetical protein M3463_14710, partial [Verrucomicrobiota bacterium]|nr:hypothetical protein [Verrucomicrobiota bacterium]